MRTPLSLALSYFLGLGLGLGVPKLARSELLALACLGAAGAVSLIAVRAAPGLLRRLGPKLLIAAAFCIGLGCTPRAPPPPLPPVGMARLRAQVEEVRYARDGLASARIRVLSGSRLSDGEPFRPDTHLIAKPFPLPEGAEVSLLASVRPVVPFRNASPHPPLIAAHPTRGIARLASSDGVQVVSHAWPARLLDRLRSAVRAQLVATLPADVEPVARAILLGDPDALEQGDENAVRGAGLSHVFAVSGMHVTLLAGLTVWLLRRALLRWRWLAERFDVPRIAAGLGIPLALSIAACTGGAPSGWRASITTGIAWSVAACGRRPDPIAVSAAACLVFGIIAPADALRPAFLLSIAATAALIGQPAAGSSALHDLRALIRLNLRTTLATAPLVFWSFGTVPLWGLVANLLLVPVGSLLLLLACGHALLACSAPVFAGVTAVPLAISARAFLRGAGAFSLLGSQLDLPPLTLVQGVAFALGATGLLFAHKQRSKRWLALAALSCCGFEEWRVRHTEKPSGELRATFVDVGQGDAAIVDLPNGEVMLIDAGGNPQGGPDPGTRALLPLLAARRRTRLDTVVLTHPHPDHYGGLEAIMQTLPIRELWDSGQGSAEAELIDTSKTAAALVERARAKGARVLSPEQLCGQTKHFGEASVRVLAPCPGYDSGFDPNDNSLVVRIDYAGRSLLFAGDIEAHAEQKLLADAAPLRADVLKVPHHGSRTSSSEPLLEAIQPQLAIISAGAFNSFGHPHPEVVQRLKQHARQVIDLGESGGTMLRIDEQGTLSVESSVTP